MRLLVVAVVSVLLLPATTGQNRNSRSDKEGVVGARPLGSIRLVGQFDSSRRFSTTEALP